MQPLVSKDRARAFRCFGPRWLALISVSILSLLVSQAVAQSQAWENVTVVTITGWKYPNVTIYSSTGASQIEMVNPDGGRKELSRSNISMILDADGKDITAQVFGTQTAVEGPQSETRTQAKEDREALQPATSPQSTNLQLQQSKNGKSPVYIILSGGYGVAKSITKEAMEGFAETEFEGGSSVFGGVRFGALKKDPGFCLDISYYRFSFELQEQGLVFGDIDMSWILLSPGAGAVDRRPGGVSWFIGILGLGWAEYEFAKGPVIHFMEQEYGLPIDVTVESGLAGVIFPAKAEFLVSDFLGIGVSFGMLVGKPATSWSILGERIPDFEKFFLSNVQLHGYVCILL